MVAYTAGPSVGQGSVFSQSDVQHAFYPEIWEATLLRARARTKGFSSYVDTVTFQGGRGTIVKWPYIGRLTSKRKQPGVPLQFETRREGLLEMTCNRLSYVAFSVDPTAQHFSQIQIASAYSPSVMDALMDDIEYSLLGERATFVGYSADSHIVSADPINYADFLTAFQILLERDVPPSEMVFHVGPRHMMTMFSIPEFIQSGTYNSGDLADIKSGTIMGTVMGVPIVLNHAIRQNRMDDIVLGGQDHMDRVNGLTVATPGLDPNSDFYPTQWGSERYDNNFTPTPLTEGYTSAVLTTRSSIKLAIAMRPSLRNWMNEDYYEQRYSALQLFDVKTIEPREGVVISTDEHAAI